MKIYIARHGQTDWNLACKAQGISDIPLNATGKKQAEALRENIKDINFSICYASPLVRAAETAQIAVNKKCEIVYDDRLIERSFGDFEGKTINGWAEDIGVDIGDLRLNSDIGNIEPVKSVLARIENFLNTIQHRHSDEDIILVVAHGQVARAFHHSIIGYNNDTDWWSVEYGNAEARPYELRSLRS